MKFGLSDQEFGELEKLLIVPIKKHGGKVWIFGSRARGDYQRFSDIDVLFEFSKELSDMSWLSLAKEDLEESQLPYKVDVVDIKEVASSYRDNILLDRIEL